MSWAAIGVLAAGAYLFKVTGLVVIGSRTAGTAIQRVNALLPAALLGGVVAVQTFAEGDVLVLDARAAGVAVGGIAAVARAPFVVVIVLAAVTTALLRLAT